MTPEGIFQAANLAAVCSWVLLAVLPRTRWVTDVVTAAMVPALLAVLYVALIGSSWGSSEGGFSSLADVATLFANPWLLLAGWVHYLAFDLLVGSWEARDAREHGVPHWALVPCLALTFLFGPAGWLLYLGMRVAWGRRQREQRVGRREIRLCTLCSLPSPHPLLSAPTESPQARSYVVETAAQLRDDRVRYSMHHKRRRPKHQRAGCLLCKPHKDERAPKLVRFKGLRAPRRARAVS